MVLLKRADFFSLLCLNRTLGATRTMNPQSAIFVGSLLVALLFYISYTPIPSDVDQSMKLRLHLAKGRILHYVAKAGEMLGFDTYIHLTRSIDEKMADVVDSDPDIEIDNTYFHGIRVRLYKPKGRKMREKLPGVIFFHGGGWTYGSVLTYDIVTRSLAKKSKMVVASVDYRLAPEFAFPTPFFDCEIATKYFIENANSLGVDPTRIAVMGDSAGGNIAAAVVLKLRKDKIEIKPKLQVLIYPCVQMINFQLPSHLDKTKNVPGMLTMYRAAEAVLAYMGVQNETLIHEFLQNNHISAHMKQHHYKLTDIENLPKEFIPEGYTPPEKTGGNYEISRRYEAFYTNEHFSPLLASDHKGLPNTFILICEHDVLRDEGMLYAKKLGRDKVNVKVENYLRGFHGMLNMVGVIDVADKMLDDIVQYLMENL